MAIPIFKGNLPYLSTEQMIEVDRAMIEDYKIELIQMMENAGRNLATLAKQLFLEGEPKGKKAAALAGTGGNGGGALVAARRLRSWGASVKVFLSRAEDEFSGVPARQLEIVQNLGIDVTVGDEAPTENFDIVLDGLIGYSLKGAPRGNAATLIKWANAQDAPVLSLDAPSGVDTSTGQVFDPAITADATMTLALAKEGLRAKGVKAQVGDLYLADISVPPQLYAAPPLNLQVSSPFSEGEIVRLSKV